MKFKRIEKSKLYPFFLYYCSHLYYKIKHIQKVFAINQHHFHNSECYIHLASLGKSADGIRRKKITTHYVSTSFSDKIITTSWGKQYRLVHIFVLCE